MRLALCILVCSLGVARAQPQPPPPDKAKAGAAYAEGQKRYAAGDYLAAARKFIEAYAQEPDPAYLFNVAQSFRFANHCEEAASYFRQFLAAVITAPNLDKVHAYLGEMEACASRQRPAPTTPPTPPTPLASHIDRGATKRHIGLALAGGGLVAIAVGVWFHRDLGYFERQSQGCTPAHPCTTEQVHHWDDRGSAASTAAIASYSIGGAALIGGSALYLLGRLAREEPPVAITPTRGGALVTAGFAF
ncbi:MAG TPA: hypothetical protein VLM79_06850 [Kofleriaceae bacterium]|nr:hypothetical protein [Kofleriaceae bacterium]